MNTQVTTSSDDKLEAAIYVRVSTSDQSTDAQESELKAFAKRRDWDVYRVYKDQGQSGAKPKRPALDEMMADCRKGRIDIVLVWKFDRFARSLRQLVNALDDFNELGIEFISSTEQIDTTVPSGKCFFQVIGAIAEFERTLTGERVKSGLNHARSQGKRLGRPPIRELTREEIKELKAERAEKNKSLRELAQKFNVSLWQVHKLCADGA